MKRFFILNGAKKIIFERFYGEEADNCTVRNQWITDVTKAAAGSSAETTSLSTLTKELILVVGSQIVIWIESGSLIFILSSEVHQAVVLSSVLRTLIDLVEVQCQGMVNEQALSQVTYFLFDMYLMKGELWSSNWSMLNCALINLAPEELTAEVMSPAGLSMNHPRVDMNLSVNTGTSRRAKGSAAKKHPHGMKSPRSTSPGPDPRSRTVSVLPSLNLDPVKGSKK